MSVEADPGVNAVETGATIGGLLRESGLPRFEAELLLCSVLGCERIRLIAHAEEAIDSARARSVREVLIQTSHRYTGSHGHPGGGQPLLAHTE